VCILVSGKIRKGMEKVFERIVVPGKPIESIPFESTKSLSGNQKVGVQEIIPRKEVFQSAIRVGKELFNRHHTDYAGMQVLNTVLGGYFGSRLMKNIREDKGYTYGIGSMIISLHHSGYFVIASEVGTGVTKKAVKEVFVEINRLRNELIPENELSLVKNYIMGQIIRMFDGPFATADTIKSILEYGLDFDYYDRTIETIMGITAVELRDLANKYLKPETFTEIIAGKY
jgi:predicted Zn-dependent peptidase